MRMENALLISWEWLPLTESLCPGTDHLPSALASCPVGVYLGRIVLGEDSIEGMALSFQKLPQAHSILWASLWPQVLQRANAGFSRVLLWLTLGQNGWEQVDPGVYPISVTPGAAGSKSSPCSG